jgi:hypothetical protein
MTISTVKHRTKSKSNGGGLRLYKSYNFRDKDPMIDKVRTVVQDSELSYAKISDKSSVSTGTLYNWFSGTTRRPQFCSMNAVLRCIGHEFVIVRRK